MADEPRIQIGDRVLTQAQATAVRVAITDFHESVSGDEMKIALGPIAEGYRDRLTEVLNIIMNG